MSQNTHTTAALGTTSAPSDATVRVTGTVVPVAAAGGTTTAQRSAPIRMFALTVSNASVRIGHGIQPTTRRTSLGRRHRRKARILKPLIGGALETLFQRESSGMLSPYVVFEKISPLAGLARERGVKLVGRPGSSPPPTRKYYDLDLDEYQID